MSQKNSWREAGRGSRIIIMIAALGATVIGTAWLVGDSYYADRIMPGVRVDGHGLGGLTRAEARRTLAIAAASYRYELKVGDKTFVATAPEVGVGYDTAATLNAAYASRRDLASWFTAPTVIFSRQLDRGRLSAYASGIAAGIGTAPVDAAVIVAPDGQVSTRDDVNGWSIDAAALARSIAASTAAPRPYTLRLEPTRQAADVRTADLAAVVTSTRELLAVPVTLTLSERTFTPTTAQVGSWVTFAPPSGDTPSRLPMTPIIDDVKVKAYVAGLAKTLDVVAVPKKVNIENGVSRVTQEGVEGGALDQDPAVAAIVAGLASRTPVTLALTTHAVSFKTVSTTLISLDEGRYIEVSLSKQRLWVWQDHAVIYETPITSGATGAGFPTVTGKFAINAKVRDTHLRGYAYGPRYNYDVQVDYWMPFYSGYGFHDASWRASFGGSDYYYGGSHGCVNLPDAAAAWIFGWAEIGTPVWVHD